MKRLATVLLAGALMVPAGLFASTAGSADPAVEKVRHELAMLPFYGVFDSLAFSINDGVVTLSGQVTRPVLSDSAVSAVRHIEGVSSVVNKIEVLPLSPFDDDVRLATYRAIYGYSPLATRYAARAVPAVRIIVKNGNVKLEGMVADKMDKSLVGMRANMVGSFTVENNLQTEN